MMGKRAMNARWLMVLVALWLLPNLATADNPPGEPVTAAVVEFTVRGELDEQAGAIIADLTMSAIANTGRFTLKDRLPLSAAAKIAKAQELGSTGLLDPKTAAELGRLYGVDGIITGGVNKLGDLITVTARLIDTKSAAVLRSGQISGKDIDSIQVKVNELAAMITAPPEKPAYALTIQVNPPDASVRLLNNPTAYQTGMRLPPGDYEVEVTKPGYLARKEAVRISDHDMAVTIALEQARHNLIIRPEPADAQVRLLNSPTPYQPGIALLPGNYEVEVTRDGYVSRRVAVQIGDGDRTVPVALEKAPPPPPIQRRLTVQASPPQATVRLLDVKTPYQPGMLLAPGEYKIEVSQTGYTPQQITVQLADNDVTIPVNLKPITPPTYRLTVQPDPPNARVRLVNTKTAYKAGVQLAPGSYTIEVAQPGYETKRVTAQIADGDVTLPVALLKQPEPPPPTQYQLTVRADPPNARIRLVGIKTAYKPGVLLKSGSYTVEVSSPGYEAKRTTVQIADSDVTVSVALLKQPELPPPTQYQLTVRPEPANARVRLIGTRKVYRPGVSLEPGSYTIEVSLPGYEAKRTTVRIADSDVTVPVTLLKEPEPPPLTQYQLTVRPEPADARVRLIGTRKVYRPGVLLEPGSYTVEVFLPGYEVKRVTVRIADSDVTMPVRLERTAPIAPSPTAPSVTTTRPGEARISAVRVDSSLDEQDRAEVMRILSGHIGRTISREALLNSAMRVYQSTGVTLSFSVRRGAAGTAELYARASRRVRRTFESNIPIMTRGQLEQSGFGVSDE